jgi:membrane fusion protein (multidrug efflux system)
MRASRFVLLASLVLAVGCKGKAPPPPERPRVVSVEPVVPGDAVERIELLGDVEGEVEVKVFAQLAERITRLHVKEGDRVKAGDPIATLHAELQAAGVVQARGAYEAAIANRDRLRDDVARGEKLAAGDGMSPAELAALRSNLKAAEAQVAQLAGAAEGAAEQRSRTVIRAPIAGVVGLIAVEEGDLANPAVPLATVARLERVRVKLDVPEGDWVRIATGMAVAVTAPALPGVSLEGKVAQVSPMVDRVTRAGTAEVLVENAGGKLRPGMVARAAIELSRRPGALLVPGGAPLFTSATDVDGRAVVFVMDGEVAKRKDVKIGQRYGDRIEILEGLAPGERVVVKGQHLLRDGNPIKVDAPAPAAGTPAAATPAPAAPADAEAGR